MGSLSVGLAKLSWRQEESAPQDFNSGHGRTATHINTAYFSHDFDIYSFTIPDHKWTKLPPCKYKYFSMAVINNKLTTIGGHKETDTNILLSLLPGKKGVWKQVLPPMPTKRRWPAAVTTHTHLVIAGGWRATERFCASEVEVLNTATLQWSKPNGLPQSVYNSWMVSCGGQLYLRQGRALFVTSVEDMLRPSGSEGGSAWTRLADIPVQFDPSLAALKEHVLAIGGRDGQHPTATIHCYDKASNVWISTGKIPTPSCVLTAVLPSNEVIVVGRMKETYIGRVFSV